LADGPAEAILDELGRIVPEYCSSGLQARADRRAA
jgi:hypothetical protein